MNITDHSEELHKQISFFREHVVHMAKHFLLKDGDLMPTAFFWSPPEGDEGGMVIVGLPMIAEGPDGKDFAASAVRQVARDTKAELFAMVMDTYQRTLKEPYASHSDEQQLELYAQLETMSEEKKQSYFESIEAISVIVESYENTQVISVPYTRDLANKPVFGDLSVLDAGTDLTESRFAGVLPPRDEN